MTAVKRHGIVGRQALPTDGLRLTYGKIYQRRDFTERESGKCSVRPLNVYRYQRGHKKCGNPRGEIRDRFSGQSDV